MAFATLAPWFVRWLWGVLRTADLSVDAHLSWRSGSGSATAA
ncbi:hypothetical protein [Kineosporia succinea]|uniref:Uncharacterized protein n=1 Tax=Kineosporia succinea TaxID=84632 RepID=A0ABT9NXV2_9ACTN|nr:hypothetical protein [Kineosporia succinea]MDP9825249.1 hypothetical protein [Kineosporia succinea]